MRRFIVDESVLANTIMYLENCPYKQVASLIGDLRQSIEYKEADKKPDLKTVESTSESK